MLITRGATDVEDQKSARGHHNIKHTVGPSLKEVFTKESVLISLRDIFLHRKAPWQIPAYEEAGIATS